MPNSTYIISSEFPDMVIPLIENAKKSIDVIVFDWRWYPQNPGSTVQLFNQAMVRAARRGVDIRVIANNDQIISTLKSQGISAKRALTAKLVHCKMMVVDSEIVVLGSHNYTQNGFEQNLEVSVIIEDDECVLRFQNYFNNLFK